MSGMNASKVVVSPSRMTNAVAVDIENRRKHNKMREMLINNRKLTIRELVEDLNIDYGSIQDIVVNGLGLRRIAAKLVPKELNFKKKGPRCHRQRHDFQG